MKKVLAVVLVGLACVAAYAETDYTVERKVDYLWRHVMGGGGGGGDYPTKEWVDGKLVELANAIPTKASELDNDAGYAPSNAVSEIAQYIVDRMAARGWEVDGTWYKLVVQVVPPPAETTFMVDGTEQTYDIAGTLDLQWMADNGLYDDEELLWLVDITSANIGTNVTSIGGGAFSGCRGLASVTIPGSVTNIGEEAFTGCDLTSVTIPDSVTSIGGSAFASCYGLTSVTIPDGVTSIGDYAFSGCSGLTSVSIGNGVTGIWDSAFSGCSGLASVDIPDSVTIIGDEAFRGCSGLASVTIGDSVTSIGESAFSDCASALYDTNSIPGVRLVDGWVVGNQSPSGALDLTGVRGIGPSAFSGCTGLTSVTIPDSVTSIGGSAFRDCTGLTSVTIGDGVTSIGSVAFSGCTGLTSVDMSGREAAIVRGMPHFSWGLPSGCVITCSDDTITIP